MIPVNRVTTIYRPCWLFGIVQLPGCNRDYHAIGKSRLESNIYDDTTGFTSNGGEKLAITNKSFFFFLNNSRYKKYNIAT